MPYYPHVVKATAGIQPAVVDKVHYVQVAADAGQQIKLYADVRLIGSASQRSRFERLRFLGRLTADNGGAAASAYGGYYDSLRDFYASSAGGSLSGTALQDAVTGLLKNRNVTVQVLGGRLVVL